jgi:hypothetical protein
VQVVLNNDKGLLYINHSQVSEFRGQEPQVGGAMGLFAQSENEQATATGGFSILRLLKINEWKIVLVARDKASF